MGSSKLPDAGQTFCMILIKTISWWGGGKVRFALVAQFSSLPLVGTDLRSSCALRGTLAMLVEPATRVRSYFDGPDESHLRWGGKVRFALVAQSSSLPLVGTDLRSSCALRGTLAMLVEPETRLLILPPTPNKNATRRWRFYLVEVAGIEPASASPLPSVLHV